MPAFMIITARIHDRDAFMTGYGPAAAKLVAQFGGQYRLRVPGAVALESSQSGNASVVVSEWRDKEAALAFWNSPEYAEVKTLRQGIADCEVLLVEAESL